MEDIYQVLCRLEQPGKKVLATIIQVTGSAYKKEGASMLFFEDGTQVGMLSAGCLEEDLSLHAETMFQTGAAKILQYDMREETDIAWGQGAGCNGIIHVLAEPLTEDLTNDWLKVKKFLETNIPVTLIKNLQNPVEYMFLPEKGEAFGNWTDDIMVETNGHKQEEKVFQFVWLPKPRLVIFGAGQDAVPLARIAATTGFLVTVCDWREGMCNKRNFPVAHYLLIGFPSELIGRIEVTANDFIVSMSHHFQRDQEFLSMMIEKEVRYLGVLGPRERTKRLMGGKDIPEWISAPVGMAIAAKGPEEIAISIIAELIQVLRSPVKGKVKKRWTTRA